MVKDSFIILINEIHRYEILLNGFKRLKFVTI